MAVASAGLARGPSRTRLIDWLTSLKGARRDTAGRPPILHPSSGTAIECDQGSERRVEFVARACRRETFAMKPSMLAIILQNKPQELRDAVENSMCSVITGRWT